MGLDDGAADRQADADAVRLGRVERLEHLLDALRIEPAAGIAHLNQDDVRAVVPRHDRQEARAVADGAHGLDRIHDQVEEHLLQLDPVARHARQRPVELRPPRDAVAARLVLRQREHFQELLVDVQAVLAHHLALRQRADARDDVARALAVGRDVVERRPRFRDVGRIGGEPARARAGAGDHPPQGLADLVGDRGGQLAERRQPRHVRELRSGRLQRMVLVPQPLLRELALGDVARQRQVEHAVSLTEHAAADLDGEHGPVAATMPGLERDRLAGAGPLREPRNGLLIERNIEIAGMHADQLVAGVTEAFARLAVHVDHGRLVVEQEEGVRRAVDEGSETRLARAQILLGTLALARVAHQGRVQALLAMQELAHADLDREYGPVAAPVQRLESHRLALADALHDPGERRPVQTRVELARVHADERFAAVAEAHARLLVDVDHRRVVGVQEERVRRLIDEGAKAGLGGPQLLLCMPSIRDIDHEADHAVGSALGVEEHAAFRLQPVHAAILVDDPVFGRDVTRFVRMLDRELHRRPIVGMDELLPALERSIERARGQAIHRLEVGRPAVFALAGADIPVECHGAGRLLRKLEHFLPGAQPLLRLPQLRDVLHHAELAHRMAGLVRVTSPWLWTMRSAPSGRTTRYSTS